ncbi:MAG: haloacid dehalogenase-like hydrolase [Bacilli bacterium]|nr:haloacid dehalogenase-like hydrolase [Bacilli bacterium]
MSKPILAIMYDFDKTLSTTDMQNYTFIPNLGLTPETFWGATGKFSAKTKVERILSYMYVMLEAAREKGIKVTRKYLQDCGKDIEFYPGVESWFERINKFGEEHGVEVQHFLVSSGTKEIVEGCKIYHFFNNAWGCEYYYNDEGEPVWPKIAINYTQKTQFFFRITKGVDDITDDASVNEKTPTHKIPYENVIYCGDGMTDIACMTLVKKNGGTSIAIYPEESKKAQVEKIYTDHRVNLIALADYSEDSVIDRAVKICIEKVAAGTKLIDLENEIASNIRQK